MTTRYVGSGGNDGNTGLSWAQRKLTLNGVEDTPVVAGDVVYVAPGVYRELLTVDVSGVSGSAITYIADVTGEHTDSVGGIVRITGSDNDITATRSFCITATAKNYRTFIGFMIDNASTHNIVGDSGCTDWIIEGCTLQSMTNGWNITFSGVISNHTIRRCNIINRGINLTHTVTVDNANCLVENCVIMGGDSAGIASTRIGGVTIKNCQVCGRVYGIRLITNPASGQYVYAYNNIVISNNIRL